MNGCWIESEKKTIYPCSCTLYSDGVLVDTQDSSQDANTCSLQTVPESPASVVAGEYMFYDVHLPFVCFFDTFFPIFISSTSHAY